MECKVDDASARSLLLTVGKGELGGWRRAGDRSCSVNCSCGCGKVPEKIKYRALSSVHGLRAKKASGQAAL